MNQGSMPVSDITGMDLDRLPHSASLPLPSVPWDLDTACCLRQMAGSPKASPGWGHTGAPELRTPPQHAISPRSLPGTLLAVPGDFVDLHHLPLSAVSAGCPSPGPPGGRALSAGLPEQSDSSPGEDPGTPRVLRDTPDTQSPNVGLADRS